MKNIHTTTAASDDDQEIRLTFNKTYIRTHTHTHTHYIWFFALNNIIKFYTL